MTCDSPTRNCYLGLIGRLDSFVKYYFFNFNTNKDVDKSKKFNLLDAKFLMHHPVIILFFLFELKKEAKKFKLPQLNKPGPSVNTYQNCWFCIRVIYSWLSRLVSLVGPTTV